MHHLLLITGSMGAGKTAVLDEISDLLIQHDIAHAAIDLDALGIVHGGAAATAELALQNLAAVCENYERAGVSRLVAAGAVETRRELECIKRATTAGAVVVCRLRATPEVMEARVAGRERGVFAARYVARVRVLDALLDEAALEDFSVDSNAASITDVASQVLERSGWLRRSS